MRLMLPVPSTRTGDHLLVFRAEEVKVSESARTGLKKVGGGALSLVVFGWYSA